MDFNELENKPENFEENFEEIEPEPIKPTQEELIELMKLKSKIVRYKVLFPHIFQEEFQYKFENLDNLSKDELEIIVEELSIIVNSRNSSNMTQMLYFEGVRVVEFGGQLVNLQVRGLRDALQQNQGVIDCLNEITLKYEDQTYTSPELRLAYLTATTILSLHKLNSSNNQINNFLDKKLDKEFTEKFNDL